MRNIKLVIEYDGTNYAGWQRQKNTHRTIQEAIEKTLRIILQEKVSVVASGRTDAGVHAIGQVANFKTLAKIPAQKLAKALNSLLPEDIKISNAQDAPLSFHARFSAKTKTYRYLISNQDNPAAIMRDYCYFVSYKLDLSKMRKAAKGFLGKHNFSAFCASGSSVKDTIRTVSKISVTRISYPLSVIRYPLIVIDITADGFLYNMVRSIVGTLILIGRDKLEVDSIPRILRQGMRQLAGPTAPAKGLYLLKVTY